MTAAFLSIDFSRAVWRVNGKLIERHAVFCLSLVKSERCDDTIMIQDDQNLTSSYCCLNAVWAIKLWSRYTIVSLKKVPAKKVYNFPSMYNICYRQFHVSPPPYRNVCSKSDFPARSAYFTCTTITTKLISLSKPMFMNF